MSYTHSYKELVRTILNLGLVQEGRNGTQRIIPHYSFTIQHMETDHILKLRKMYYKGVMGEFLALISNNHLHNVSQFEEHGCNYWSKWAGKDGTLVLDYYNELHPQLEDVIEQIKVDPSSRRHVISLWNHTNVTSGTLSLPCCWHNLTFSVINRKLHLTWTQRSVDTMVGLPSDVYLAYLFMHLVAGECDLEIGSCMFALSNVHIYEEHILGAMELLKRTTEDYDKPLKFELKE